MSLLKQLLISVTVAIVAILTAVAYPSYVDYIRRGQLPEGMTNLSDFRVKLEQYYQDHRGYGALEGAQGALRAHGDDQRAGRAGRAGDDHRGRPGDDP